MALVRTTTARFLLAAALCLGVCVQADPVQGQDWDVSDRNRDVKLVERLLDLLEDNPFNAYAFKQLQKRAPAVGGMDSIIERYQAAAAADTEDIGSRILLARLVRTRGDTDLALRYLDEARAAGASGWRLSRLRGILLADKNDFDGATSAFEEALDAVSKKSAKVDLLRELGDLARRNDRIDDAVAAYERIVEIDPDDRYLRWELAAIFFEQQMWDQALEQYRAAARLAGRNVEERARAELEIAGVYERMGRFEDAIATYDTIMGRARESNWLHKEARTRMVSAYRQWGNLDGLLKRVETRLERRPNDAWALGLRARLLDELNRDDEAIEAYRALLDRAGDDPDPDVVRAFLGLVRSRYSRDDTIAAYERVIDSVNDSDIRLRHELDLVRYIRTTSDVPLDAYARLNDIDATLDESEDSDALDRRERVADAYLAFSADDATRRAREIYDQILEADPERTHIYKKLLALAAMRGEHETEKKLLDELLSRPGFDTSDLRALVEHYESRNDTTRARAVIDMALEKRPEDPELLFMRLGTVDPNVEPHSKLDGLRELMLKSDSDEHLRYASQTYVDLLSKRQVLDDMIDWTRREWSRNPSQWRHGRLLFYLLAGAGRLDDAQDVRSNLLPHLPASVPLEEHALALLRTRHPGAALRLLRALARKHPRIAWRYKIDAASMMLSTQKRESAARLLAEAIELAPDNPDALASAADLYERLGDYEKALELLGRAVNASPRRADLRASYGTSLLEDAMRNGDQSNAQRAYDLAIGGLPTVRQPSIAEELLQLASKSAGHLQLGPNRLRHDLENAAELTQSDEIEEIIRLHLAQRVVTPATP